MDWPLAISRNRDALRRIVAALFALAGLRAGGALAALPRHVFLAVLSVLRPAEAAVRRLIVLAAHGLALGSPFSRAAPQGLPHAGAGRQMAFQLLDPLKHFDPDMIWNSDMSLLYPVSGNVDPAFGFRSVPSMAEPVPAASIGHRLNALMRALEDLPRQARRLARWQARRDLALQRKGPFKPVRVTPFRPGLPPGWRQRRLHEIDDVLRECHGLALNRINAPDSS